jgi:hypothetical protein
MLYQLPDGRTIELSLNDFLSFSDEELKSLVGYNYGEVLNNPLYGSAITKPGRTSTEDEPDYSKCDIPDVPSEEKFKDQDYIKDEE